MTLRQQLRSRLVQALVKANLPAEDAAIMASNDRRFGDYQSNIAMLLAKSQRSAPRVIANTILQHLEIDDLCEPAEIAGAGFINFRILPATLAASVQTLLADPRLGVPMTETPRRIILDFSSPNVAKPMHVGHIRSTILGDSLARIARFLGNEVITDNHLGDWGTQFGKIIYGWKHLLNRDALAENPVPELLRLYRKVTEIEADTPEIAREVRSELVRLQQGDAENLAIWQDTVELSWIEFQKLYDILDISFNERLGESFYNERLRPLVERLLDSQLAEISEGATCVFFRDIPSLAEKPCLIRKSDGGFLYATTDLATIEYRKEHWNPDAIWYVTGAPQDLHFQQVFEIARRMGFSIDAQHIAFGSILGEDRKIMKTRSGENVQLADVLTEAIARAKTLVQEKNPEFSETQVAEIAQILGIGAVKYAELSQHRMSDYVFSWEKMLAFHGNTAPYLQNAYVRIRSIFRRLGTNWTPNENPLVLNKDEEVLLALTLLRYGETLPEVLEDFRPNILANYLYELANIFHSFYEACPVLKSEAELRESRLTLCETTARIISHGLSLLGIQCPEKM